MEGDSTEGGERPEDDWKRTVEERKEGVENQIKKEAKERTD